MPVAPRGIPVAIRVDGGVSLEVASGLSKDFLRGMLVGSLVSAATSSEPELLPERVTFMLSPELSFFNGMDVLGAEPRRGIELGGTIFVSDLGIDDLRSGSSLGEILSSASCFRPKLRPRDGILEFGSGAFPADGGFICDGG